MMRTVGLTGRLAPRAEADRFAIKWAHEYLGGALPTPVYPIDVTHGISDWGMLGNDQYGDCVPAAWSHDRMLADPRPTITADEVVQLYLTYDHGADDGVVIADFLLYLYQQKLINGFAPVQLESVDAVMAQLARGVILGVNLTDDAQQLFSTRQPWTIANGERPDPADGHGILKVKAASLGGIGTCVTWGDVQQFEHDWGTSCIEEAFAVLNPDDMSADDYAAMCADLDALPQVHLAPIPTPPAPAPAPAPEPVPAPPAPEPAPTPPAPVPAPPAPPAPPEPKPTPTPEGLRKFEAEVRRIAEVAVGDVEKALRAAIAEFEGVV